MHCALEMPVPKHSCNFEKLASCFTLLENGRISVDKTIVPSGTYNSLHSKISNIFRAQQMVLCLKCNSWILRSE